METTNLYLHLISGNEIITISACKGGEKAGIYYAKEEFPRQLELDFLNYKQYRPEIMKLPQPETEMTNVHVYEMYNKSADFKAVFGSLIRVSKYLSFFRSLFGLPNPELKSLAFESQEQIVKFCSENREWLRKDGKGILTFFLFTEKVDNKERFFVAVVSFVSDKLWARIFHFSEHFLWNSSSDIRIVVPATKTSDTQS